MKIYCRVTECGLVPMYDSDYDEKCRLKIGEDVLCTITKPRNYEFHKKFWALVRLTFDNLPERIHRMLDIYSIDDMAVCLKLELGYANTVWHGGRQVVIPKSISFEAMDETEFERFYQRSIDVILAKYLRGSTRQEIIDEVERFK